jgi:uncharacterized protein (TIGR00369 family)
MTSRITEETFRQVLRDGMPGAMAFEVLTLERGHVVLRRRTATEDLRPGETVAGPVVFALADLAVYAAVMTSLGPMALAVTTDATIHFLRRPRAGFLVARARLLKEGRRLVVGEVTVENDGEADAPVAHAVMTYSIPPDRAPAAP